MGKSSNSGNIIALSSRYAFHAAGVRFTDGVSLVTGQWSLVTGHWSLVTGHWSLVTGHWSLVTGHWSLVTGHWSLVTGHWSLVTGHWSLVTRPHSQMNYDVVIAANIFCDLIFTALPRMPALGEH